MKRKIKIDIPTNAFDINLNTYQTLLSFGDGITSKQLIDCVYGINIDSMQLDDVQSLTDAVEKSLSGDLGMIKKFNFNGVKFGMIPHFEKISYGENADLNLYLSNPKYYHKALAILYRPITKENGDKYSIEDYEGTEEFSDMFKDTPSAYFLSAQVFFCNLTKDLQKCLLHYSHLKMMKKLKMSLHTTEKKPLQKNGVNINRFYNSVIRILQK